MDSAHRQRERLRHSQAFAPRILTPAEIEARRIRPSGSADERAKRVRQILDVHGHATPSPPIERLVGFLKGPRAQGDRTAPTMTA